MAAAQSPVQTGYGPVVAYEAITSENATVNISNSPAGATNATGNNLAGARNSTIGNVPGLSYGSMAVPVYILPFPAAGYTPQESAVTPAAQPADITGSVQSFSAYSTMADPLARAARELSATQHQAGSHIYSNADLQRLEQQSQRTASVTVSTVQLRENAQTEAAQAIHDRNLGFPAASENQPPVKGKIPAE